MTAQTLLLGLDVGTTSTKALAFGLDGHAVASASQVYELGTPQPGWVEQNPEDMWAAVVQAVRAVTSEIKSAGRITALSLASQGGTTIPVDRDGAPVHNAISWMDQRGGALADATAAALGSDYVQRTTGWPLRGTLPLHHIGWLREHRPDVFAAADRFLFVNDFVAQRLTGSAVMNPSDGTMTQLMDIQAAAWDPRLLDYAGLRENQLSEVRPSGEIIGRVRHRTAEQLGLPSDTLVVNGAHDQYCAAVGTGVTQPGAVLLSCGTAWIVLAVPASLAAGRASGMALSCHAIKGRWGGIRSLGGIGTSLEWLVGRLWNVAGGESRTDLYRALNAGAASVAPGADGLIFLPLLGGHCADRAQGGFVQLTLGHGRNEMARAVMEGIVFELRWALEEIGSNSVAIDQLTMVGGAAESPIWPRIVADATGKPVALPAERQAAALGAAILAGVGSGVFGDAASGYRAMKGSVAHLGVREGAADCYARQFEAYRRLCEAMSYAQLSATED